MATTPMMAAPGAAMTPMPEEGAGGYTICIEVGADGSLMVGVEKPGAEMGSEGSPADDDSGMKPAQNIKEALTMALEIFKNEGEMMGDKAGKDFEAGFTGAPTDSGAMA